MFDSTLYSVEQQAGDHPASGGSAKHRLNGRRRWRRGDGGGGAHSAVSRVVTPAHGRHIPRAHTHLWRRTRGRECTYQCNVTATERGADAALHRGCQVQPRPRRPGSSHCGHTDWHSRVQHHLTIPSPSIHARLMPSSSQISPLPLLNNANHFVTCTSPPLLVQPRTPKSAGAQQRF